MYVLKLYKKNQSALADRELSIELTRQFMTLFANANRSKNQPAFTPQDFWKLSYDKNTVEERPLSLKEAKELLGSRIRKNERK